MISPSMMCLLAVTIRRACATLADSVRQPSRTLRQALRAGRGVDWVHTNCGDEPTRDKPDGLVKVIVADGAPGANLELNGGTASCGGEIDVIGLRRSRLEGGFARPGRRRLQMVAAHHMWVQPGYGYRCLLQIFDQGAADRGIAGVPSPDLAQKNRPQDLARETCISRAR